MPPAPGGGPLSARAAVGELADRLGVPARMVVVTALLVAAACAAVAWLVLGRSSSTPPELTIPYAGATSSATSEPSAPTSVATEVIAHAAGAVVRPGVYALPPGARVGDLLNAAGGPSDGADLDRLNLAALVTDGDRVYVPLEGEVVVPSVSGPSSGSASGAEEGPVDLNTADATTLETLPGVGPATAAAIIDHRERHGPFRSVDDLLDVRGIGDAKLATLRDLVVV